MFPYKIEPVEESLNRELMNDFHGEKYGFVQVGPKKWCLPAIYADHAQGFYNFPIRTDDVWLVTFPRSGTTVFQELIWLINNNLDYKTSSQVPLEKRFPFFEYALLQTPRFHEEVSAINNNDPQVNALLAHWRKPLYEVDLQSPRHFKTHLPYSLLPPDLTSKCKTIYVARNPMDVAVSYFHHNRLLRVHDYKGDFNKYWKYFKEGLVVDAPFWEHVKEGWELRNNKNVLFLFYEDLMKDMPKSIRQVANFLHKSIDDEDVLKLCSHLDIENFRKAVQLKILDVKGTKNDGEQGFIRKGKIGSNAEFSEELKESAEQWIQNNLTLTDLRFPVSI